MLPATLPPSFLCPAVLRSTWSFRGWSHAQSLSSFACRRDDRLGILLRPGADPADLPPIMGPQPIEQCQSSSRWHLYLSSRISVAAGICAAISASACSASRNSITSRPTPRSSGPRAGASNSARWATRQSSAAALAFSGIRGCASMPRPNTARRPNSARSAATPSSAPAAGASTRMTATTPPSC